MICLQRLAQSVAEINDTKAGVIHRSTEASSFGYCFPLFQLTWVVLLERGEVGVGVEHGGDGGQLPQLLVLLPALEAALVVGEPVALYLGGGGWRGRGGRSRGRGPGAFLSTVWTEEPPTVPSDNRQRLGRMVLRMRIQCLLFRINTWEFKE